MLDCFPNYKPPLYFTLWCCRESKLGAWRRSAAEGWGCRWEEARASPDPTRRDWPYSASAPTASPEDKTDSMDSQRHEGHVAVSEGWSPWAVPECGQTCGHSTGLGSVNATGQCWAFEACTLRAAGAKPGRAVRQEPDFSKAVLALAWVQWTGPPDAEWEFLLHKDLTHSVWSAQ